MNKKRQRKGISEGNGFEEWGGYMAAKKNKLQDQFNEQAKKDGHALHSSTIFKGVSIFVNGYTVPSADDLKTTMMVHGGSYHHYFSSERTTHIIASNLPDVKVKQLKSLHVRVVKPEWIAACLDAGRQVDYRPFLLYSHQSTTQNSIVKFARPSVEDLNHCITSTSSQKCHAVEKPEDNAEDHDLLDGHNETMQPSTSSTQTDGHLPDIQEVNRPIVKAQCATESNFLSDFFSNSRLHHISTMGAKFKQYVNKLRVNCNGEFPGRERLKNWKIAHASCLDPCKEAAAHLDEDFGGTHALSSLPKDLSRVIMHIDMDCFFVSVGLRKHPHLRGEPVAVTHSKGGGQVPLPRKGADRQYEFSYYKKKLEEKSNKDSKAKCENSNSTKEDSRLGWMETLDDSDSMSEIASCSYEARSKGVKNGMFMGTALKLCPDLKVIPYDFDGYQEVAHTLYQTVASYTLDIEAVSCDEMFVDCTSLLRDTKISPLEFAACLREEIREKTQCPASTGFGTNRLLARLATRKAKPDGMFFLEPTSVEDFMKTVKVTDLPGVGYAMANRLKTMKVLTCGDLQKIPLAKLQVFGTKTGDSLYEHCRGRDEQPLNFAHQRKSVSAEVNYGIRFKNHEETVTFLQQLATELQTRLQEVNMKGRGITLKLMVRAEDAPVETAKYMGHGVCDNITRSSTLVNAICDSDSILRETLTIFKKLEVNPCDLRGIGIQISRLEENSNNKNKGALFKFLVKKDGTPSPTPTREDFPHTTTASIENKCSTAMDATDTNSFLKPNSSKSTVTGIDKYMVSRKKSTRRDNISKLPAPSDLDLAVFSALPEDIRNEILEEYSNNKSKNPKEPDLSAQEESAPSPTLDSTLRKMSDGQSMDVSLSQVDPSFLDALPTEMRNELTADLYKRRELKKTKAICGSERETQNSCMIESKGGFCAKTNPISSNNLSRREVKDMISKWVFEEKQPLHCDVHILKHYFQDLISNRSIDDLYTIIRGFFRCVSKRQEEAWAQEYTNIVSSVQSHMQEVYHCRLEIEDSIIIPSSSVTL